MVVAEVGGDDVEVAQPGERLDTRREVVEVSRVDLAGDELGTGVTTLTGDELGYAVAIGDQDGLVTGRVPRRCEDPNAGCDLLVAVDDPPPAQLDVGPLGDSETGSLRCDEFG